MSNNTILNTDELDIIFCNRNKLYGAYTLRKYYPNRIKTALAIVLVMVSIFSALAGIPFKKANKTFEVAEVTLGTNKIEKNKNDAEKPKKKEHKKVNNQQKFTSNLTIVPINDSTDKLDDITVKNIGVATVVIDVAGTVIGDPYPIEVEPGTDNELTPKPVLQASTPINNPDVQASYPGGANELLRFLQKNLQSPSEITEDTFVQVSVKFVVGFDGNLQHFEVVKDGGTVFNNEVIRVLKKMPKWIPGKVGGVNVPVYYTIPVKFSATD
jgi:protein TonB